MIILHWEWLSWMDENFSEREKKEEDADQMRQLNR